MRDIVTSAEWVARFGCRIPQSVLETITTWAGEVSDSKEEALLKGISLLLDDFGRHPHTMKSLQIEVMRWHVPTWALEPFSAHLVDFLSEELDDEEMSGFVGLWLGSLLDEGNRVHRTLERARRSLQYYECLQWPKGSFFTDLVRAWTLHAKLIACAAVVKDTLPSIHWRLELPFSCEGEANRACSVLEYAIRRLLSPALVEERPLLLSGISALHERMAEREDPQFIWRLMQRIARYAFHDCFELVSAEGRAFLTSQV
jgi:hypothetical protein